MGFSGFKGKHTWWYAVLAISCIHLFLVNVKSSHDWGDDFAQYIHQAKNIVEGKSQLETGFIFNKGYAIFAPPAYAVGFPLMLAPLYAMYGNNVKAFTFLISACLFLSGFVFFRFFRNYFNSFASYLAVLMIMFNPMILDFKMEVLSEIPFVLLLYILIQWYASAKRNMLFYVLFGIATGYLLLLRNVGAVFVIAILINETVNYFKNGSRTEKGKRLYRLLAFAGIGIGIYILVNNFLFHIPSQYFKGAVSLFNYEDTYDTFLKNIDYYFTVYQGLFETHPENIYLLFSTLLKSFFLSFAIIGMFIRIKRGLLFIDIFFLAYMIVLFLYPTAHSGFRYVLLVLPVFILYAAETVRVLYKAIDTGKFLVYGLCILSFYLVYKYEWDLMMEKQTLIIQGPQRLDSRAMFHYIETNTNSDARILYFKPRALALYTGRNGFVNNPDDLFENLQKQLKEYRIEYILINEEISDKMIKEFVAGQYVRTQMVFSNSIYKFYKILTN